MTRTRLLGVVAATLWVGCSKLHPERQARMEIRRVSGNVVQFVPAADQLPYCLIYTQSDRGVTRQMTMTQSNASVGCPAGEPVLGRRFRITSDEGTMHIRVLFSDMRLQAASVVSQVLEMTNPAFKPMDLRLPGKVVLESLDFIPTDEPPPLVGEVVRPSGDAGDAPH